MITFPPADFLPKSSQSRFAPVRHGKIPGNPLPAGQKELQEKCLEVIQREEKLPQAIVLVQGSLACVEEELGRKLGIPVMSGLHPGVDPELIIRTEIPFAAASSIHA